MSVGGKEAHFLIVHISSSSQSVLSESVSVFRMYFLRFIFEFTHVFEVTFMCSIPNTIRLFVSILFFTW